MLIADQLGETVGSRNRRELLKLVKDLKEQDLQEVIYYFSGKLSTRDREEIKNGKHPAVELLTKLQEKCILNCAEPDCVQKFCKILSANGICCRRHSSFSESETDNRRQHYRTHLFRPSDEDISTSTPFASSPIASPGKLKLCVRMHVS